MPFAHKRFDVGSVKIELDPAQLSWPRPGEANSESTLGGNRQYQDLRLYDWEEVRRVLDAEQGMIQRIEAADNVEETMSEIQEEREAEWEECDGDPIHGLDIGVAGAVIALSAARCVPFTSCNGGAFDGGHLERHPLIAFYMRPQLAPIFIEAAKSAGAGLESSGSVMLYADEITAIVRFAEQLYARRAEIDAIPLPRDRSGDDVDWTDYEEGEDGNDKDGGSSNDPDQGELF